MMSVKDPSRTILVIDDEEQIRRALTSLLKARGYRVVAAATGLEGYDMAIEVSPDLVILDLTLPDTDGIELSRELRTWSSVPILVLSVRGEERAKIDALDTGADDYLTKPFAAGELLARVRALLRRTTGEAGIPATIQAGDIEIDFGRRRVRRAGEDITLTKTEFEILAYLAENPDRVLTSRMILEHVWGEGFSDDRQILRTHVHNLRRKIEPHPSVPRYVITEPGVGFRFCTT